MCCADKEEYLKTYNEEGTSIGIELRSKVHKEQKFHKEVAIWIINSRKEVLLERRSKNKMLNPGKLSLCAGHVVEKDSVIDTIIREVQEEIGLDISSLDFKFVTMVKRKEPFNYCFSYHYILFSDVNLINLTIQPDELSEVIYMKYEEFKNKVRQNDNSVALIWSPAYQKVFHCIDQLIAAYFQ